MQRERSCRPGAGAGTLHKREEKNARSSSPVMKCGREDSHNRREKIGSVEIISPSPNYICEGDPLSPPEGEAAQGDKPP